MATQALAPVLILPAIRRSWELLEISAQPTSLGVKRVMTPQSGENL
jgi:hypothetical protein